MADEAPRTHGATTKAAATTTATTTGTAATTAPAATGTQAAALVRAGRFAEAEAAYRALVAEAPDDPVPRYNLGMLKLRAGDAGAALACFERCRGSRAVVAELGIGRALTALGRIDEAIAALQEAARMHGGRADVHNALGVALEKRGDVARAEAAYRDALAAEPTHGAALSNLYGLLGKDERAAQAELELAALAARFPDDVGIWYKLACVRAFLGRIGEAESLMRRVAERVPGHADAWLNLGTFAQWRQDAESAIAHFRRALSLSPDSQCASGNLAHALLYAGRYDEGWREYENRPFGAFGRHRPESGNAWGVRWDGRPLPGGTLLLHGEGGFGDVLQFVRYAIVARARVGAVVLWLAPQYDGHASLVRRVPGIDRVARAGDVAHADAHASLSSLPYLLRDAAAATSMPYLAADATASRTTAAFASASPGVAVPAKTGISAVSSTGGARSRSSCSSRSCASRASGGTACRKVRAPANGARTRSRHRSSTRRTSSRRSTTRRRSSARSISSSPSTRRSRISPAGSAGRRGS